MRENLSSGFAKNRRRLLLLCCWYSEASVSTKIKSPKCIRNDSHFSHMFFFFFFFFFFLGGGGYCYLRCPPPVVICPSIQPITLIEDESCTETSLSYSWRTEVAYRAKTHIFLHTIGIWPDICTLIV